MIGDFVPVVVIRLIVTLTEIRRKELLCFILNFTIFSSLSLSKPNKTMEILLLRGLFITDENM